MEKNPVWQIKPEKLMGFRLSFGFYSEDPILGSKVYKTYDEAYLVWLSVKDLTYKAGFMNLTEEGVSVPRG
jgi:hypothetical protein